MSHDARAKLREALNLVRVPDLRGPSGATRLIEREAMFSNHTFAEWFAQVYPEQHENEALVAAGARHVPMHGIQIPVGFCGFFCDERGFATRVPEPTPGTYR